MNEIITKIIKQNSKFKHLAKYNKKNENNVDKNNININNNECNTPDFAKKGKMSTVAISDFNIYENNNSPS